MLTFWFPIQINTFEAFRYEIVDDYNTTCTFVISYTESIQILTRILAQVSTHNLWILTFALFVRFNDTVCLPNILASTVRRLHCGDCVWRKMSQLILTLDTFDQLDNWQSGGDDNAIYSKLISSKFELFMCEWQKKWQKHLLNWTLVGFLIWLNKINWHEHGKRNKMIWNLIIYSDVLNQDSWFQMSWFQARDFSLLISYEMFIKKISYKKTLFKQHEIVFFKTNSWFFASINFHCIVLFALQFFNCITA